MVTTGIRYLQGTSPLETTGTSSLWSFANIHWGDFDEEIMKTLNQTKENLSQRFWPWILTRFLRQVRTRGKEWEEINHVNIWFPSLHLVSVETHMCSKELWLFFGGGRGAGGRKILGHAQKWDSWVIVGWSGRWDPCWQRPLSHAQALNSSSATQQISAYDYIRRKLICFKNKNKTIFILLVCMLSLQVTFSQYFFLKKHHNSNI